MATEHAEPENGGEREENKANHLIPKNVDRPDYPRQNMGGQLLRFMEHHASTSVTNTPLTRIPSVADIIMEEQNARSEALLIWMKLASP